MTLEAYHPDATPTLMGGRSIDGVLGRSDGKFTERVKNQENHGAIVKADREGKFRADEYVRQDIEEKKTREHNWRAKLSGYEIKPGSSEAAKRQALTDDTNNAIARQKEITGPALEAVNTRVFENEEISNSLYALLNIKKTEHALEPVETIVTVPDGTTFGDAIATKLVALRAKKRRRTQVKNAWLPPEALKRAIRTQVRAKATLGEPHLTGILDADNKRGIGFELRKVLMSGVEPAFGKGSPPLVIDVEALACRYFGDAIIADLEAQIDAEFEGELGDETFEPHEKRRLLAVLDREIDLLERELAELVWLARDAGEDTDFPPGLPAAAILGVKA